MERSSTSERGASVQPPSLGDAAPVAASSLVFERDGAQHHPGAACDLLPALDGLAAALPEDQAGQRLRATPALADLLAATGSITALARRHGGATMRPVRAVLFDKSPAANWALGWHQDRTIVVRAREALAGFGPWSVKDGLHHVEPPFDLLATMVTLRVHLDDVPANNAPLLIALGSHVLGRVPVDTNDPVVARADVHACLARRGDVWTYATPILHASARATAGGRRRVLQVDYSAADLPAPLAFMELAA